MSKTDLPMWVLYDHPSDYPEHFVARKWLVVDGNADGAIPTPEVLLADELAPLRRRLEDTGLIVIPRFADDEPQIVEVWI